MKKNLGESAARLRRPIALVHRDDGAPSPIIHHSRISVGRIDNEAYGNRDRHDDRGHSSWPSTVRAQPPGQPGQGGPPNPLLQAFDTDHDGTLSAAEIDAAAAKLRERDANKDGKLTADELPRGPGGRGGPGPGRGPGRWRRTAT